jgi:Uncharacterised nucleotidyltransferase
LPPASPFGNDFLHREWPVLLGSCSLPRDPAKISAMVDAVRDAASFICLAEAHGVLGHFSAVLGGLPGIPIPTSFLDLLRVQQRAHLLSNLAMTAELFRILELFRQSQIECVVVKGPVLSLRAYGDPAVRQYADLDLLLRQEDIPRAAEILVAGNYDSRISAAAIRTGKIPGEYRFRGQGAKIILELHTERTLRYFPFPLPIEKYFQSKTSMSLDGRPVPALSAEHEFILISVHGATHFWERLMWISDVAAMVHNHPELDWIYIRQSAAEVGAERMVRVALLLSERLLGVRVPAEMKNDVARDPECSQLVDKIEKRLPFAGNAAPSIAQRAWFRFRMRGNVLSAAAYLARLSFSPTEDDWPTDAEAATSALAGMLRRPFRLARKYRRDPDS